MRRERYGLAVALWVPAFCGCATVPPVAGYHTVLPAPTHDVDAARQANERGVTYAAGGDYEKAEKAFREALSLDIGCAAAHNNLGLVLLHNRHGNTGQVHAAALELSFAMRLNPRAVEPRMNLAGLLERAGLFRAAATEYEAALALDRDNTEAMGRLARVYMKTGTDAERLNTLLRQLAGNEADSDWKTWALAKLAVRGGSAAD